MCPSDGGISINEQKEGDKCPRIGGISIIEQKEGHKCPRIATALAQPAKASQS